MTVKEIVHFYLVSHGYDGLFNEDSCACLGIDLAPCDEMRGDCQAGFKIPCPSDCGDHDFHISAEKDADIGEGDVITYIGP
jgi:hypothetical protein